jgi:hypothetical protein
VDVSEMFALLNDHGFEDTLSVRKLDAINDTVADICSREPWPFLEKTISLTFDGSNAKPTNFPADFSKEIVLTNPSTGGSIPWERVETVRRRFGQNMSNVNTPQVFYFRKGDLLFWPIPPTGTAIDLEYVCFHPEVSESSLEADFLIPARHHRAIMLGALVKLYAMEDDPEQATFFKNLYDERIEQMREDLSRRQYDRPDRIFVVDEDDYDIYG